MVVHSGKTAMEQSGIMSTVTGLPPPPQVDPMINTTYRNHDHPITNFIRSFMIPPEETFEKNKIILAKIWENARAM